MSKDVRVEAIRNNKLVGRGSCSSIDECWEDSEIVEWLNRMGMNTTEKAVTWALNMESSHLERGLEQRWGDDCDPQLLQYKEFQRARKAV